MTRDRSDMPPVRKSSFPVRPLISGPAKIEPMRLHVLPRRPASTQPPALAADRAFGPELDGRRALTCGDDTEPTGTGRDDTADVPHLEVLPERARRIARDCNILCDWSHRRRPAVESARLRLILRRADTEKGAGF